MPEDKKGSGALAVPKYPHGSTTPRAEKWRSWSAILKSAFGMKYSVLTTLLSQEPDATQEFWGFTLDSLYDWYNITAVEERTLRKEFMMSQYALYHALTESFQQQQRHIIESHAPEELTRTLRARYQWPLGHDNLDWLPFGILCLQAIGKQYDESGVTDAIAKHTNFEQAKPFNPADVDAWASKLTHAWTAWKNVVSNPDHMAAVQILKGVLDTPDSDWKSWGYNFSITQGNAPYTVEGLIDKVQQQDKLHKTSGKASSTALMANGVRGKPNFKKKGGKKTGGTCHEKGCTRKTNVPFKFCDPCFAARRNRANSDSVDVPGPVRDAARSKKMQQLRTKMAQLNKKDKQALLAEFTSTETADSSDEETATPKKKKKKKKVTVEANVATAVTAVHAATSPIAKAPTARKKKSVKFVGPLGRKTTMALQNAKSARKVKKGKAKSQALVALPWLEGCTVQKFAGCDVPSHYRQ